MATVSSPLLKVGHKTLASLFSLDNSCPYQLSEPPYIISEMHHLTRLALCLTPGQIKKKKMAGKKKKKKFDMGNVIVMHAIAYGLVLL